MVAGGRLRIGIAGLGQAGAMFLPSLRRHARATLASVADPRPEARAAFRDAAAIDGSQAVVHDDIDALCADPQVDLVYIATPTQFHAEHARRALGRGKHVIVEKPMALTLAEAEAMTAAAERAGLRLIVGHSQSFEPPVRAMRAVVRGGELGALGMLHTWYYTDWLYRPRRPEELDTALGGGVLFRQGAHQVDLLRWIGGGLVRSVRAATGDWDHARRALGSHVLFLEFAGGAVATAVFSGYDHFHSTELTFGIGEDGRRAQSAAYARARAALATAGPEGEARLKAALGSRGSTPAGESEPEHASFYGLTVVSCERGDIRQTPAGLRLYGDRTSEEIPVPLVPAGRDLLLDEACAAVLDGVPPAHDGRWGMANLEVCVAALTSARERRDVALRYQVPTPDASGA
jgi:phthalate 4,5-cis-dihydrodiol dehydrogenase